MEQDKRKHDVTLQKDSAQSAILNSLFRQRGKRKSRSHGRIEGGLGEGGSWRPPLLANRNTSYSRPAIHILSTTKQLGKYYVFSN